jgi:Mrp family chromosome partitioning ATPase
MLETLKQAEGPRQSPGEEDRPALRSVWPDGEEQAVAEPESETEIPFIEVGPRRSMEASSSVLASLPAPAPATVTFRRPAPEADAKKPCGIAVELVAFHSSGHPVSEQYRGLVAALTNPPIGARPLVLIFMAARAEINTTTVLLNVAVTAARQGGCRVTVVDAAGRGRTAALLGLPEGPGLREVLGGTTPLEKALKETDQPDLVALTAGASAPSTGVRLLAETMRSILRQLRQRFDLVLVDGPVWDGRADSATLATACDAVCLVVPEAEAESPEVDNLLQAIPRHGARLAGCILAG